MRSLEYTLGKAAKLVFLTLIVLCSLFPIYWTLVNSFRTNTQIMSQFRLFPEQIHFENFMDIFALKTLPNSFLNSCFITGSTMLFSGLLTLMAAFALSTYRFKLAGVLFTTFLAGIFIPGATTMGMIYMLLQKLRLLGSPAGIILLYTAGRLPLSIFLMVAFMRAIPGEVKEAAIIDGCSPWRLFLRIVAPLSQNGLLVVLILTFINVWNEYIWSMILLPSASKRTLTVALAFFKGEFTTDYGLLSAGVIVGLVPIMTVYLLLHDKIIGGLAAASIKG